VILSEERRRGVCPISKQILDFSPTFLPFLSAPQPVRIFLFLDDNKAPPTAFFALRPQPECLQQARRSLKQAKALHDGALFRLSLARCLASRQQQPQPQQQQQQISSAREAQTGFVRDRERRSLALRQATSKEAPVIRAWQ
jgi:hypothetical protein